ncbi:nitroreductase family protein [Staphylococcus sp. 17KM0847]|uniref:nitroreductase family protein n=1 Tax=Staphylococcus sp. 17KM0847 TaxID=2583989 RepID=UPI0015DC5042|nr:nitroreductase family protein [Staphylococcus sp. 17KM0847]QLK86807.1 nitroreductase family protein [Staphylococcus sp. 17KM0847]
MPKNNNFDDILNGRRSVKLFDENVKIPHEEMDEILRQATKAPSSINMQPWRFVVVESEEGKDKLRPLVQLNTRQNDTSAAMIVIFGDMLNYEFADDIYSSAVEQGFMPQDIKEELVGRFVDMYQQLTPSQMNDIVKIDSSLAAMQLMLVARQHGYDTNPIGGFDHAHIAEAFDLDPERYVPVLIVAMGKAAQEGKRSTRLPIEKIRTYH